MNYAIQPFRTAVFGVVLCAGLPLLGQAPEVADWKVAAPSNAVQLAAVDRVMENEVKLSFKNTAEKTVVEFRVFRPSGIGADENGTGLDAFTSGTGSIAHGAMMPVTFSEKDSGGNPTSRSLRIAAVVYSDGTAVGDGKVLEEIEDEMVGAALEIRRDADILATSPDPSAAGIDAAVERIGRTVPSSVEEAVNAVNGIALTGIPQIDVDARVNHRGSGFLIGVNRARQMVLLDLDLAKSSAAMNADMGSEAYRQRLKDLQSRVLADLAGKWTATQAQTLRALLGVSEAGN